MDQAEIDAIIAGARTSLLAAFHAFLRAHALEDLQPCCFPSFQISVKRRRYVLQVTCAVAPTLGDAYITEQTPRGPLLIHVDPETGARRVVISMTPRSILVFQAHSAFAAPLVPVIEATIAAAELRRSAEAEPLMVNPDWREPA